MKYIFLTAFKNKDTQPKKKGRTEFFSKNNAYQIISYSIYNPVYNKQKIEFAFNILYLIYKSYSSDYANLKSLSSKHKIKEINTRINHCLLTFT